MSGDTDKIDVLQVLSFQLGSEYYAIEIEHIQEVLEYRDVTRVPKAPKHMEGVINLRGHVIPVIDLRVTFGLNVSETTPDTCIIIIDIIFHGEKCAIGVVADSVKEVVEFSHTQIKPAPQIGMSVDNRFIAGMVEHDDELVVMLSVGRVFSDSELEQVVDKTEVVQSSSTETKTEVTEDDDQRTEV